MTERERIDWMLDRISDDNILIHIRRIVNIFYRDSLTKQEKKEKK